MRKICVLCMCIFYAVLLKAQHGAAISGVVLDAQKKPLSGASVHILNTGTGANTDAQGGFAINNLHAGNYVLQVSAVGFATITKDVAVTANMQPVTLQLHETTTQLDAVIVSAEKKEETLQQVPYSVTAISSKQVDQYRIWNSKDLTAIVPNLYAGNPGDNRNVISIRGITTTSYDPAVATYIDGVNQFTLDTYIAQLYDVDRMEVLRGPQGTLYGRNAMGGVINIITKEPTNKTSGFGEVNIGNYGQQRYVAGIRTPFIKDKLFFGFSAMYEGFNGFYNNDYNNSHFDKQHTYAENYFLKYRISSSWMATLNFKHQEYRNHGSFALAPDAASALENPFHLNQNALTTMVDNTINTSLSIVHSGSAVNFTSQTAYQSNYRYYKEPIDGDFSPIDGVTIINNYGSKWNNVKVLTQEFKFTSPASSKSPLQWTAGTYLFYQNNPNKQATRFGKDAYYVTMFHDSLYSLINTTKAKNYGVAFYGQLVYTINHKTEITAGLRYDYEHKKQDVLGEYQHDPDPNPAFETRPDTSATAAFHAISPKVSIAFHPTQNQNIYITYSRGYRTGGLTPLSSDPSQPPLFSFKPEYSNNYEAGIKNSLFNNKLLLNIAAFYTRVTNAQVPTLILPDAVTITKNAGKLTSKGAELELAATPFKGFEAGYNFGYTHATYNTLKLSQNGSSNNLAGKRQVFTPDVTSMLNLQYTYAINKINLIARGEWQYLGRQYFDLANTIQQSPYNLYNLRAGIAFKAFQLMFWERNIGNKKYIAYAYDFGAAHLGNPKTYGVTLKAMF